MLRREGRSQHGCGLRAQKADLDQTCADKPAQVCSGVTARRLIREFRAHSSILNPRK